VDGYPTPRVQWQKDDNVFRVDDDDRITRNGNRIVFNRLLLADSGRYDCIAFNDAGSATSTVALRVIAQGGLLVLSSFYF